MKETRDGFEMHHVFPKCRYPQFAHCSWNKIRVTVAEHFWYHEYFYFQVGEQKKPMDVWEAMAMLNPLNGVYDRENETALQRRAWDHLFGMYATPKEATSVLYDHWTPREE